MILWKHHPHPKRRATRTQHHAKQNELWQSIAQPHDFAPIDSILIEIIIPEKDIFTHPFGVALSFNQYRVYESICIRKPTF